MFLRTTLRALIFGSAVLLGLTASRGWAQEDIAVEAPPPSSVEQSVSPIGRAFVRPFQLVTPRPLFFPWLREQLKDTPAFFRDTKLDVNQRTYYFNGGNFDGTRSEALAIGGALSYESGLLFDRLSVGSVLYTSQPLYAPADRGGTLLLEPVQEGYTVLGQLYGRVKLYEDIFLNLGRYHYDTPYISKHDDRMTPNTFEGYTLMGRVGDRDDGPALHFGGGFIQKIKGRNDDDFVWMSQAAGASVNRGVGVLGALFSYRGFTIGGVDYYSPDIINIAYGEVTYTRALGGGVGLLLAAQYTDQRSVGDNLLMGFPFSTSQLGLKLGASLANAVLTFGYTRDGDGADIQTPWSGTPGYTSVMVENFKSAGEQAFLVKGSYDFSKLGLSGLTAYTTYVHGWGTVSPSTKQPQPNLNEIDFDISYRPSTGALKGLWFRFRYGHVVQYQGTRSVTDQFRIVINYDFSLL